MWSSTLFSTFYFHAMPSSKGRKNNRLSSSHILWILMNTVDDSEEEPNLWTSWQSQCDLSEWIFSLCCTKAATKAKTCVLHLSTFNCTKTEFILHGGRLKKEIPIGPLSEHCERDTLHISAHTYYLASSDSSVIKSVRYTVPKGRKAIIMHGYTWVEFQGENTKAH